MYKRIRYVSRLSQPMDEAEIQRIGEHAAAKNAILGITGFLMTTGGLFYQVLEGPAEAVDELLGTIRDDPRHSDVLVLGSEDGVTDRLYPGWTMQTVNLDAASRVRLMPLKVLMRAVFDQAQLLDRMTAGLERALLLELDRPQP